MDKGPVQRELTIARQFLNAVFLIALLFVIVSIANFFNLRGEEIREQGSVPDQAVDTSDIMVPIAIYLLRSDSPYGSQRTIANAQVLLERVNRVWEQAGVDLTLVDIQELDVTEEGINFLANNPAGFMASQERFAQERVNAFLVGSLSGANGIAYPDIHAFAVADQTTVFDYRAFAHEVGHIFGLEHVPSDRGLLMFQGANGLMLTPEEVYSAREDARTF